MIYIFTSALTIDTLNILNCSIIILNIIWEKQNRDQLPKEALRYFKQTSQATLIDQRISLML